MSPLLDATTSRLVDGSQAALPKVLRDFVSEPMSIALTREVSNFYVALGAASIQTRGPEDFEHAVALRLFATDVWAASRHLHSGVRWRDVGAALSRERAPRGAIERAAWSASAAVGFDHEARGTEPYYWLLKRHLAALDYPPLTVLILARSHAEWLRSTAAPGVVLACLSALWLGSLAPRDPACAIAARTSFQHALEMADGSWMPVPMEWVFHDSNDTWEALFDGLPPLLRGARPADLEEAVIALLKAATSAQRAVGIAADWLRMTAARNPALTLRSTSSRSKRDRRLNLLVAAGPPLSAAALARISGYSLTAAQAALGHTSLSGSDLEHNKERVAAMPPPSLPMATGLAGWHHRTR